MKPRVWKTHHQSWQRFRKREVICPLNNETGEDLDWLIFLLLVVRYPFNLDTVTMEDLTSRTKSVYNKEDINSVEYLTDVKRVLYNMHQEFGGYKSYTDMLSMFETHGGQSSLAAIPKLDAIGLLVSKTRTIFDFNKFLTLCPGIMSQINYVRNKMGILGFH